MLYIYLMDTTLIHFLLAKESRVSEFLWNCEFIKLTLKDIETMSVLENMGQMVVGH